MFRGNIARSGVSSSSIAGRPSLQWVAELGEIVSSPVVSNKIIYAPSMLGSVYALQMHEKRILWKLDLGSPLISSPVISNNTLIVATFDSWVKGTQYLGSNYIVAIDVLKGEIAWKYEVKGDVFSSPCVIDNLLLIGSLDRNVYALDLGSGQLRWKYGTDGEVWSSPAISNDTILIGSDDGHLYCLDREGNLVSKVKLDGRIRSSSPCISDEMVFVGTYNGTMYGLRNGVIKWELSASAPVLSSPAVLDDHVFFACSDHKLYCLNKNNGKKIWDFETENKLWSSPALTENALFIGSLDGHIYSLDPQNGRLVWQFPTMQMVDSSPCIADEMLFIGSRDGILYAFGSTTLNYIS
ncbi:MAG: outer membrane protein assembly factor BamB [Candidatus Nitrosomirales archaeon]|jgi:outer membrane protein assembly factor BamB